MQTRTAQRHSATHVINTHSTLHGTLHSHRQRQHTCPHKWASLILKVSDAYFQFENNLKRLLGPKVPQMAENDFCQTKEASLKNQTHFAMYNFPWVRSKFTKTITCFKQHVCCCVDPLGLLAQTETKAPTSKNPCFEIRPLKAPKAQCRQISGTKRRQFLALDGQIEKLWPASITRGLLEVAVYYQTLLPCLEDLLSN